MTAVNPGTSLGQTLRVPANLKVPSQGNRFIFLDALRGLAALAVIFYHRRDLLSGDFFTHGYLAVDFFFM
jgi:peptidoglycan/LPS O-acetylase OafA/YrhL